MPEGAIFIAWGAVITGREVAAADFFKETKKFFEGLRQQGEITSFEPFMLSHTGDQLRGFFILKGDVVKLANLMMRDDFVKLTTKASLLLRNLVITPARVGEDVTGLIETYKATAQSLMLQHA